MTLAGSASAIHRVNVVLMQVAIVALFVGAALAGFFIARAMPPDPVVITVRPETFEASGSRASRGSMLPAAGQSTTVAGQPATSQVPCTLPAPDAVSTCVNGFWQTPPTGTGGGGRSDLANGCVTMPPTNEMICRNGVWIVRGGETPDQNGTTSATGDSTRRPSVETPSAPSIATTTPSEPTTMNVRPTTNVPQAVPSGSAEDPLTGNADHRQ